MHADDSVCRLRFWHGRNCEAKGYEVEVFSADLDPAKQINQIETAVNQGFDGIILDLANADAVIPGVQYAQEAGVPIVTMHEDVTGNVADATSKADFKEGGILKMQHCVDQLGGKGRIAIINGALGQTATTNIRAGHQEVLDANPDIEVVFEDAGDWSTEPAIKLMESWLSTGEQLDAVVCMNDAMALGVISVLEAAGKDGILIYGLDALRLRLFPDNRQSHQGIGAWYCYGTARAALHAAHFDAGINIETDTLCCLVKSTVLRLFVPGRLPGFIFP